MFICFSIKLISREYVHLQLLSGIILTKPFPNVSKITDIIEKNINFSLKTM